MPDLGRLLVTGSRHWNARDVAHRVLFSLLEKHGPTFTVVHGDADGVDAAFDMVANMLGLKVERHPARWDDLDVPGAVVKYRKDGTPYNARAGPIRNAEMIRLGADFVLAVHKSLAWSTGTKDCVRAAIFAGLKVYLIDSDDDRGRRIHEVPSREGARG